jgi:hypothetical protein
VIVRPDTVVIRWHRSAFRAFWTWKGKREAILVTRERTGEITGHGGSELRLVSHAKELRDHYTR